MVSLPAPPLTINWSPLSALKMATGADAPVMPMMPAFEKTVIALVAGRAVDRHPVHLRRRRRPPTAGEIDMDASDGQHRSR